MSIKIFLSATFSDMKEERVQIIEAFRKLRVVNELDVDLFTMEDFGPSNETSLTVSLKHLGECDAYLCLFGYRYGSIPEGKDKSYMEIEYDDALKKRMPIFCLLYTAPVNRDNIEPNGEKWERLRRWIESAKKDHTVCEVNDIMKLGYLIIQYFPKFLKESFPSLANNKTKNLEVKGQAILHSKKDTQQTLGMRLHKLGPKGYLRPGAILYANVVEYSPLSTQDQEERAQYMLEWINRLPVEDETELHLGHRYWARFGGGDLLIYAQKTKDDEKDCIVLRRAFFLALDLLEFIIAKNFQLGITLHWANQCSYQACGPLVELWGNEIDKVRRLMSFSDGGHFFISSEAFSYLDRDLFGGRRTFEQSMKGEFVPLIKEGNRAVSNILNTVSLPPAGEDQKFHLDQMTAYDRHYCRHEFYNFYVHKTGGEVYLGNPSRPPDYVKIEHRDKKNPTDPNQCFVKHLIESDSVCIVALTHEKTCEYLDTALKERNKRNEGDENFWKRLDIIFPSERFLNQWVEHGIDSNTRKRSWEEGRRTVIQFLETTASSYTGQWDCLETESNLTFWGNRLLKKGDMGIIRLAPLLPGPDLKDLRYVTFHNGIDGYEACSQALDIMLAGCVSILEWNLIGSYSDRKQFTYKGIAKRSHLKKLSELICRPVVLVILYMDTDDGLQILIQKRSIFNATDQYGKFSNISGRLCLSDTSDDSGQVAKYYTAISCTLKNYNNLTEVDERTSATEAFQEQSGWKKGMRVEDEVWQRAVVREIREELGLELQDRLRIQFFDDYHLQDPGKNLNLYFKVHALKITPSEFLEIKKRRPHADLHRAKLSDLDRYCKENKLNHFLQRQYTDFFKPTLKDTLKIV